MPPRDTPKIPPPPVDARAEHHHVPHQAFWLWVLCLTGVDYFSTLAYQPSIAFIAAGRLAPIATVFLVLLTLLGAVPIYFYVAAHSPHGRGSIAMLQQLLRGWWAKILVLVLLGFAATDFVITMTLSSADAAEHLLHNPLWKDMPDFLQHELPLTLILLVILGALFLRGFREVIGMAVLLAAVFLLLNILVVGAGLNVIAHEPDLITEWWHNVRQGELGIPEVTPRPLSFFRILLLSLIFFPKLILGLSGFETGVAVMPLIRGNPDDNPERPAGRIRNAHKLLLASGIIMSIMLMGSSVVITLLISPEALIDGGSAANRALAYLAHGEGPRLIAPFCGEVFGTIYDLSTVAILWFAGASAMSGLLNLIPRYLPQYGMAPSWAAAIRPLVLVITAVSIVVTLFFNADVTAQGAAYATGVMVLMLSACVAVVIGKYREALGTFWRRVSWSSVAITGVFAFATLAIMIEKPDGLLIALTFVGGIVAISIASRILRSGELRVVRFDYADDESKFLWESLQYLDIPVLAPHRPGGRSLEEKERELREWHHLGDEVPVVFIEIEVGDPSDFFQEPLLRVKHEEGRFVILLTRCTAVAPALAAIALALAKGARPVELHFGWSDESPLRTNLQFLLFGEGNVPWLVRDLLRRAEPDEAARPRVVIG